jgi:allantoinase
MDYDKALHSTQVVTPKGIKDATIFIKNGKIVEIRENTDGTSRSNREGVRSADKSTATGSVEAVSYVDFGDAVIMPGIIDAHVHINEPGRADWEGFDTATRAAAAGGVTTLIEMPLNASPVTTTVAAFEKKLAATEGKLHVNCGFYGGLVPRNLKDLPDLMKSGVFGIKCFLTHSGIDEFPNVSEDDLKKAMPLVSRADLPLLVHAELSKEHAGLTKFQYQTKSYQAYLTSRPKSWENKAIEMLLPLCKMTQCRTHIVHLSSADLMRKLKFAKEVLPLTVETTPQYLYFNAEDIPDAQTIYKCAPPIREAKNNAKLWEGLKNGTIDFIASDHSPAPPSLKEIESGNLAKAWGGISGLQFTLPVVWTKARELGFTIEDIVKWLCSNPARFLDLHEKGNIEVGKDADLTIWNPDAISFTVDEEDIQHRHKITPYLGKILRGGILQTYVNGELVFDNWAFPNLQKGRVLLKK